MEASVYADLMSTPSSGGHAPSQIDLHGQLLVIAVALVAILLIGWLWPSSKPFAQLELLWTVAPRENDRVRIRRLILPPEALDFSVAEQSKERSPSFASWNNKPDASRESRSDSGIVRPLLQLTESVGAVLSPTPVSRQQPPWDHSWTFRTEWTQTEAARDCTPLLVFINRGSGGRQGEATLAQLRSLLTHHQVVDLSQGHAEQVLQSFRSVRRFRVLVCGGDGTVGWVLSLLDSANLEYTPPVAILPLGTGNDLARALGWGGRHPGRDFIPLLEEVDQAQVALLDRWQVDFPNARVPKSQSRVSSSRNGSTKMISAPEHSKEGGQARKIIMQNYLGVGVDAKVALEWHQKRQLAPQMFTSRFRNKVQYALYGAKHLMRPAKGGFAEICSQLTVIADGVELELPPGTEGIIVLNIASYGGGSDLWGTSEQMDEADHRQLSDLWNVDDASSSNGGTPQQPLAPSSAQWAKGYANDEAVAFASRTPSAAALAASAPSAAGGVGGSGSGRTGYGMWESRNVPKDHLPRVPRSATASHASSMQASRQPSRDGTSSDNSADEWEGMCDALPHFSDEHDGMDKPPPVQVSNAGGGGMSKSPSASSLPGDSGGMRGGYGTRAGVQTPPAEGFVPASMDDGLLEVVVVEGVLQLGLAQMSLTNARRLCQCRSITITSSANTRLPLQVDGEPFEVEPMFAPRKPMSISISHHNQSVMLSRSRVRSDGVALEAIDWAMQQGVLSVDQRNKVVREIARRTGSLQRRALSSHNFGGSNLSLPSLANLG